MKSTSLPASSACGIETKLIIAESAPLDVHGRCQYARTALLIE